MIDTKGAKCGSGAFFCGQCGLRLDCTERAVYSWIYTAQYGVTSSPKK